MCDARGVAYEQAEQNERMGREFGGEVEHLIKGHVVDPGELDTVGERGEGLAKGGGPVALERRVAEDDDDVVGIGDELEDVLDESLKVKVLADEGGVFLKRPGGQRPLIHAGIENRRLREEAVAELRHKAAGRRSDGDDQVRLPLGKAFAEQIGKGLFHVRLGVSGHVEGELVKVDAFSHFMGEGGLERCGVSGEGRGAAAEGMNDQDAFRSIGGGSGRAGNGSIGAASHGIAKEGTKDGDGVAQHHGYCNWRDVMHRPQHYVLLHYPNAL